MPDWEAVVAALPQISEALASKDLSYALELSKKRRVTLSDFRGSLYVSVREWYTDKSGKDVPGAKGLNLAVSAWEKLVAGATAFTTRV